MRVRPLIRDERDKDEQIAWMWEGNAISQLKAASQSISKRTVNETHPRDAYQFDHLFTPDHTNEHIYSSAVQPVVSQVSTKISFWLYFSSFMCEII